MVEAGKISTAQGAETQLWQRWREGQRVDVAEFLAGFRALEPTQLVAVLLIDQSERWKFGERIPAESYLRRYPTLESDSEAVVELVFGEFLLREANGDQPALEEYCWRFPLHHARLCQQVALHRFIADKNSPVEGSDREGSTSVAGDSHLSTQEGKVADAGPSSVRYRRLRPHAQGGLGEVHVALDEELHREVALKEIQERFADHPESRLRFVREAEITGHLEHPGVVPVYGLGAHADGRPFYAMRFIRGESMEEAIHRFHKADENPGRDSGERTLVLRELLGRFVAVCNAVGYAHSRGVIHRDLKPANVMFGDYGETLVVDWGLARALGPAQSEPAGVKWAVTPRSGSDCEATEAGQIVGTAGYMPPEQANGRLDEVGPASDVFALGATLYCLFTNRAPYTGTDALLQAAIGEHVPARQHKRSVPPAMEAVCAKAMAANPQDRYVSPRALAEEVQRWLADEPVNAYRDPLPDRLRRWSRRHRTMVSAGMVLLVTGVVGLTLGLWAVEQQKKRTEWALGRALTAEEIAQKAEADTLADYRASTDDAIEQLIGSKPALGVQEKVYLEKTLARWQGFAARSGDDERSQEIRAEGLFRVAGLRAKLGQGDEAVAGYLKALPLFQKLADDHPAEAVYLRELAGTHASLGTLLQIQNQVEESAEHIEKALTLLRRLADDFPAVPEYRHSLALIYNNLGNLQLKQNLITKAEEQYQQALTIHEELANAFPDMPQYGHDLASTYVNLGNLQQDLNQGTKSAKQYHKALEIAQELATRYPAKPRYRRFLALTHHNLGNLFSHQNQDTKGAEQYEKALAIQQKLAGEFPSLPDYRCDLAKTYYNRGNLFKRQKRDLKASEQYQQALVIQQRLADEFPSVPEYRSDLTNTHLNFGSVLADQNQPDKSAEHYQQAITIMEKLADYFPTVPAQRNGLAKMHINVGVQLANQNQGVKAAQQYQKALTILQNLADSFSTVPEYRQDLALAHKNLGDLLRKQNQVLKAAEQLRMALTLRQKLADEFPDIPQYRRDLAVSHEDLGSLLMDRNQVEESLKHQSLALTILRKLAGEFPDVPVYRKDLALTHHNLGILMAALNQADQSAEHKSQALALMEKLANDFPTLPEYRQLLAGTHNSLGVFLLNRNQLAKSAEHHARALAIQQKLASDFPEIPGYRNDLAMSHSNLGRLLAVQNHGAKAAEQYDKALALFHKLAIDFPAVPEYRKYLSGTHVNLGDLLINYNQLEKAAKQFSQARTILEKLTKEFSTVSEYRYYLAAAYNSLGDLLLRQKQWEKSAELFLNSLAVMEKLANEFRGVPEYQVLLGGTYCNYGILLHRSGKSAEGLPWFDKAIRTLMKVYEKDPGRVRPRHFLRISNWNRAEAYDQLGKHAEAVKDWSRALELSPRAEQGWFGIRRADSRVRAGQVAEAVAESAKLAKTEWAAPQWYDLACIYALASSKAADKKQEYADQAMVLLHKAVKAGYRDAAHLVKDKDLEVLRERTDFKKLLADVEARARSKKTKPD